jgi:hypothetical protein
VFPKAWRRIVGTAYSPHGLRHAYASAAHELGLGELTIGALLGHARLGVTSGYVATIDSFLLAAAEKVARHVVAEWSARWCSLQASELPGKPMPSEWPRRYTPDELDAIAASIAPHKIDARNIERLHEAVEAFSMGKLGRPQEFSRAISPIHERGSSWSA